MAVLLNRLAANGVKMKKVNDTVSGKLYSVYRILLLLLMIVVLLVIGGCILSLIRGPDAAPLFRFGNTNAAAAGVISTGASTETQVFNGIGRLRIPVAGIDNASTATLIVSIAFPYPPADRSFTEELASKISSFKSIANDYFSSLPAAAFIEYNEENIKAELLKRFNALLRLGKIEVLYFNDLLILEAEQ